MDSNTTQPFDDDSNGAGQTPDTAPFSDATSPVDQGAPAPVIPPVHPASPAARPVHPASPAALPFNPASPAAAANAPVHPAAPLSSAFFPKSPQPPFVPLAPFEPVETATSRTQPILPSETTPVRDSKPVEPFILPSQMARDKKLAEETARQEAEAAARLAVAEAEAARLAEEEAARIAADNVTTLTVDSPAEAVDAESAEDLTADTLTLDTPEEKTGDDTEVIATTTSFDGDDVTVATEAVDESDQAATERAAALLGTEPMMLGELVMPGPHQVSERWVVDEDGEYLEIANERGLGRWWSYQDVFGRRFYASAAMVFLLGSFFYCVGIGSLRIAPTLRPKVVAAAPIDTATPTSTPFVVGLDTTATVVGSGGGSFPVATPTDFPRTLLESTSTPLPFVPLRTPTPEFEPPTSTPRPFLTATPTPNFGIPFPTVGTTATPQPGGNVVASPTRAAGITTSTRPAGSPVAGSPVPSATRPAGTTVTPAASSPTIGAAVPSATPQGAAPTATQATAATPAAASGIPTSTPVTQSFPTSTPITIPGGLPTQAPIPTSTAVP